MADYNLGSHSTWYTFCFSHWWSSSSGRYVFPLSVIAGAGCLAGYYTWVDETAYLHAFSPLIRNLPNCNAKTLAPTSLNYATYMAASDACTKNRNCVAFDWQGMQIGELGEHKALKQPQTTFYGSVAPNCEKTIASTPDASKVFRFPIFIKGTGAPTKAEGDVYLDTTTTDYYFFDTDTRTWLKQGAFAHDGFTSQNSIDWGTIIPTPSTQGVPGSIYVYYAVSDPVYFHVYVKNPDGWKKYETPLKGPGLIPDAPANLNVTGFTTIKRKKWLLYLGGSLLVVGILGSIVSFSAKKHSSPSPSPPPKKQPVLLPRFKLPQRKVSPNPFDEDYVAPVQVNQEPRRRSPLRFDMPQRASPNPFDEDYVAPIQQRRRSPLRFDMPQRASPNPFDEDYVAPVQVNQEPRRRSPLQFDMPQRASPNPFDDQ
jgi:hypothetical protein